MLNEFKDLQNLYDSIEDLERIIKSMDLEPTLNEKERVLAVPTDKTDVLNEALKVVNNYKKLK
jgi:hypothetical protein|tara:strand:+ start:736 stop:924 length:189 start_codon:yes stop_codon:yes gene_type:complete